MDQSPYIRQIAEVNAAGRDRIALMNAVMKYCGSLSSSELPPLTFVNTIGSDTFEHFKGVMAKTFGEFMLRYKLSSSSRVLDIGCGCGRFAYPFSMLLRDGYYYGVDVWDDGIKWCSDHFSMINQKLEFHSLKAENNYYFENVDYEKRNAFSLPFVPSQSLDFAFAISVFTHLRANDSLSYLKEIQRGLNKTGAAHITTFIIDEYFFEHQAKTGRHKSLKEIERGCFHAYSGQDFFAGFTMPKWQEMITEAGLQIVSYEAGKWAQKPGGRNYQDAFTLIRQDWTGS